MKILILLVKGDEIMRDKKGFGKFSKSDNKTSKKNPLDHANDNIRFRQNEEFGLITVSHPDKNNSEKLSVEEVIKKMDENQGGMA